VAAFLATTGQVQSIPFADKIVQKVTNKKKYTPLLFFKVPKGLIPECDAMEETVLQVEKELGVTVERMDILRNPENEAILGLLTSRTPPFLYHRESCQIYHITPAQGEGERKAPIVVDKEKIRAWAKGRFLTTRQKEVSADNRKVNAPTVVSQKDISTDQEELLEDMALTPEQRKGKQAIKDRTEAKAKARQEK
jgi:hypothetical protein